VDQINEVTKILLEEQEGIKRFMNCGEAIQQGMKEELYFMNE
jgi:hypothetical protein